MSEKHVHEEIRPGVWVVHGVAPKPGTVLTPERLAKSLMSLNPDMSEERAYQMLGEIDEWKREQKGIDMPYAKALGAAVAQLVLVIVLAVQTGVLDPVTLTATVGAVVTTALVYYAENKEATRDTNRRV